MPDVPANYAVVNSVMPEQLRFPTLKAQDWGIKKMLDFYDGSKFVEVGFLNYLPLNTVPKKVLRKIL
jgi:hypothetical protein